MGGLCQPSGVRAARLSERAAAQCAAAAPARARREAGDVAVRRMRPAGGLLRRRGDPRLAARRVCAGARCGAHTAGHAVACALCARCGRARGRCVRGGAARARAAAGISGGAAGDAGGAVRHDGRRARGRDGAHLVAAVSDRRAGCIGGAAQAPGTLGARHLRRSACLVHAPGGARAAAVGAAARAQHRVRPRTVQLRRRRLPPANAHKGARSARGARSHALSGCARRRTPRAGGRLRRRGGGRCHPSRHGAHALHAAAAAPAGRPADNANRHRRALGRRRHGILHRTAAARVEQRAHERALRLSCDRRGHGASVVSQRAHRAHQPLAVRPVGAARHGDAAHDNAHGRGIAL